MIKDLQHKGYLYDPDRFADLINGVVCSGKRILSSADLTDMDSQVGFFKESENRRNRNTQKRQRYRDLVRKAAFGVNNYHIYVCEVRKFENTDVFQTDIKHLDEETYDVIAEYTKTEELMHIFSIMLFNPHSLCYNASRDL